MEKIKFKIKINNFLSHRFNGIEEEKEIQKKPEKDQAETRIYRCDTGNVGVPSTWVRGAFIQEWIAQAGKGGKGKAERYIPARCAVEPTMMDTGKKDYEIHKATITDPDGRIPPTNCVRPLLQDVTVEGILVVSVDKSTKQVQKMLEDAMANQGVGANRKNGFGRGTVVFP